MKFSSAESGYRKRSSGQLGHKHKKRPDLAAGFVRRYGGFIWPKVQCAPAVKCGYKKKKGGRGGRGEREGRRKEGRGGREKKRKKKKRLGIIIFYIITLKDSILFCQFPVLSHAFSIPALRFSIFNSCSLPLVSKQSQISPELKLKNCFGFYPLVSFLPFSMCKLLRRVIDH